LHRLHGRKSLAWRLPLLISALLIAALAAFAFVGYQQLTRALMTAAKDRVQSAAHLLARTFETSVPQLRADLSRTASDSAVQRVLRTNNETNRAAAQRSLADKISKNTQVIALELRGKDGKRLVWADCPAAAKEPPMRDGHALSTPPKGLAVGAIVADRGTLFYEATIPIIASPTDTIGTLSQFRQVSSAQTAQLIGGLIGSDATLLFGSPGGIWTNLSTVVPTPPPIDLKGPSAISYAAADGSVRIGASAPVKLTPWILWVDIRTSAILAPARRFLGTMVLSGFLILIVGALGAWLITRRITAPLHDIALAARDISTGDYSRRVAVSREDELGVLADSFNGMAHEIEDSHRDLEGRVVARTSELATALGELRAAQESLVQKEKLAMLGLLAGGVGHELRNPLGVMTNAVYYLGAVLKDSPAEIREYLGILSTQINLSEKIVGDLLDFARIKPPRLESVSLKQVVDEQLQRAGSLEGVSVNHDFPHDLPNVRVDRVQIGQVVLNLITNALQSMNGNGANLTLRGRRAANGFVRLDVIDTGTGMTPDQMERLFEPLFTTKARGIGLGLAVSRGLVQANGGAISAESKTGAGTTMSVSLPTADARAA
jgi:signal transduction histidine kinase